MEPVRTPPRQFGITCLYIGHCFAQATSYLPRMMAKGYALQDFSNTPLPYRLPTEIPDSTTIYTHNAPKPSRCPVLP
jgi:hypothetical protein